MGLFGSSAYEKYLADQNRELKCEIKQLKAYNKSLEATLKPCKNESYSRVHFSDSEEISRLNRTIHETLDERDYFRNICEERRVKIRDLECKISEMGNNSYETRLRRILKQYEKDAKEDKEEINRLSCEIRERKDKITAQSKQINELEKELQMYKEFFAGNEVKVFLKDKEVSLLQAEVDKLNSENGFRRVE